MFNGLFSTLFGKSKENNILDSDVNTENNENNQQQDIDVIDKENFLSEFDGNVRVVLLDEDKDWLFVETETQHPSLLSPSAEENHLSDKELSNNNLQLVPFKSILSHLSTVRENDENCLLSANLPSLYPNTMDESWFLTPPSCFSSASIQLETSPIENLLIEHPSMSVYHNIHRRPLTGFNSDDIEDLVVLELSSGVDNDDAIIVSKGNKRNKGSKKSKTRPNNGTQRSVALVLVTKTTNAVTGKPSEQRSLAISRSFFDRNNKAVRNSYKKNLHTINQPSSRTMSRKN
ncbi:unnamed protein product [Chironomus riparius]|uniref:Tumor protein p53-inducible nuclear protein 1 n=1 Tax=Chironomus riparius TaxID=315576 RepID=A0A9N9WRM9_9DIPT|nr:unnamed protein product [Chironomus riparius]